MLNAGMRMVAIMINSKVEMKGPKKFNKILKNQRKKIFGLEYYTIDSKVVSHCNTTSHYPNIQ